jgi:hypothetical protein
MTNEADTAGTGAILKFFTDIHNLMDVTAHYKIGVDEIQKKYPAPTNEKEQKTRLPEEIDEYLQQIRVNIKFAVIRCHLQAKSIQKYIPDLDIKKLDEYYRKIDDKTTPDRNDIEEYTILLYTGFINGVLPNLLRNIEDYEKLLQQ